MEQVIDQDRIIRFARAEGEMQRKLRAPYRTDQEVEETIRSWLRCYALFFGTQIVLQEEIDRAVHAFRVCRGLHGSTDWSQRTMVLIADAHV